MPLVEVSYRPPGPVARDFLRSGAFVRGIKGPIGSGKSTACVIEILRRAAEQPQGLDGVRRSRWGVIRNTYPELKTTTIKTWHQWVPVELGKWQAEGPPTHRIQQPGLDLEVMFLALDRPEDIRKLLSLELTGAWINEAREVPKAILDGLTGRVGRYPPARLGGTGWCGILLDTNAPDTDHWWYRLAEEERPDGYAFFSQAPGDGPEAENIPNLPAGYYDRAKAGKTAEWIKVYLHGQYGFVQDGKPVFPEYRDELHCQSAGLHPSRPLTAGIDFGLTPAAVIAQKQLSGQWRVVDELVAEDMGAKRFGEILSAKLRSEYGNYDIEAFGDPAGDQRAQTDETTPFQILKVCGIDARPAPSNDPVLRREAVAAALTRLVDGEPGLIIDPRCRRLRKALMGAYRYRRVQVTGTERYRDVPEKDMASHVADALQYALLGGGEGRALIRRPRASPAAQTTYGRDYDPLN